MGDNWGQRQDSNLRFPSYEHSEMTYFSTLLYYLEVPTGLEPVNNGFAIRRLPNLAKEPKSKEVMAVEGYKSSIYSTRTPYSLVAPLAPSINYRGVLERDDTQHVCLSLLGHLYRPYQAVLVLLL